MVPRVVAIGAVHGRARPSTAQHAASRSPPGSTPTATRSPRCAMQVDRTCAVPLSRSKAKPAPSAPGRWSASTVSRLASPRLANGRARSSRCVTTLPRNVRVGPLLFTSRLARTLPAEASASVVSTRSRSIGPEALTAPDTTSGRRCQAGDEARELLEVERREREVRGHRAERRRAARPADTRRSRPARCEWCAGGGPGRSGGPGPWSIGPTASRRPAPAPRPGRSRGRCRGRSPLRQRSTTDRRRVPVTRAGHRTAPPLSARSIVIVPWRTAMPGIRSARPPGCVAPAAAAGWAMRQRVPSWISRTRGRVSVRSRNSRSLRTSSHDL